MQSISVSGDDAYFLILIKLAKHRVRIKVIPYLVDNYWSIPFLKVDFEDGVHPEKDQL